MKKTNLLLTGLVTVSIALAGCGEKQEVQQENNETTQGAPKTASQKEEPKQSQETTSENQGNKIVKTLPSGAIETTVGEVTTYSDDPVFKYFKGVNWKDNFDGLVTEIPRVALTDKAKLADGTVVSIVNIKFKLHNTTQGKFTTYPDQARLVTSTGEQIEDPTFVSKHIGGEIDKGVMKEANVSYQLERGNADKIKWIKLTWRAHQGPETKLDTPTKEYEIELKIPQ